MSVDDKEKYMRQDTIQIYDYTTKGEKSKI